MIRSTGIQIPRLHPLSERAGARAKPKVLAFGLLLFVALHAPLALALKLVPDLSTLHALISLAIVLMFVIRRYPTGWVVAGCAYLVGSETLWRMTHTLLFWEFGKYALLLVVAMTLCLRRPRITSYLPAFYLALLVPSVLLTILAMSDLNDLRQTLSFNLSGPVAYAACSLFLLGRNLSQEDVLLGLTAMLAPIAGVAALTLFGIATTDISFGSSSMKATSGGFGPNEVSAALGLGMVVCFLLLTGKKRDLFWKGLLIGLLVWFGIHSALTFSRSGLYYAAAAMMAGTAFLVTDVRRFVSVLVLTLALAGLVRFVVVPRLDAYTGGALLARFENKDLTGRGVLMENDLDLFSKHPVLGVGVGMGDVSRAQARGETDEVHSHTEFTRLLSEHGLLGAAALVLILVMSARSVMRQSPGWPKVFSASLVVFALIFMTGSGMRLAIPSFLLAFAGVRICRPQLRRAQVQRPTGRPPFKPITRPFARVFPRLRVRRTIAHGLFKAKTKP
jgi:O-antigen ligase